MNSRASLALIPLALVLSLAGCAVPEVGPASDPGPIDVPVTETPDGGAGTFLDEVIAGQRSATATLLEQWQAQGCTVQQAVDGGTGCSTYLTSGALTIETFHEILLDYTPGGDFDELSAATEEAYPAARFWAEQECNWETTEECADAGQTILDGVTAIEAALVAWEAQR